MKKYILLGITLIFVVSGCKKTSGEGGNSSIIGNIKVETRLILSNSNTIQDTLPGADEDVYILYGDHVSPDDKVVSNYDGDFEFRNLRNGDYTIYVYSKDTTTSGDILDNKMPIIKTVTIDDRKQTKDLENLFIYED